jgi:transposase
MARRIKLTTNLSVEALEQRYRHASEGIERSHWQILWLLRQGHPAYQVARMTGYSAYWIGQIARRFNQEGEEGMVNHRQQPRPSPLALLATPQALDELRQALAGPAPHGDVWNSRTVAGWLSARAGRRVSVQTAWTYLRKLEWTSQVPRPRHVKAADPLEQEAFKKSSLAR